MRCRATPTAATTTSSSPATTSTTISAATSIGSRPTASATAVPTAAWRRSIRCKSTTAAGIRETMRFFTQQILQFIGKKIGRRSMPAVGTFLGIDLGFG
jgi:hypothetical protein